MNKHDGNSVAVKLASLLVCFFMALCLFAGNAYATTGEQGLPEQPGTAPVISSAADDGTQQQQAEGTAQETGEAQPALTQDEEHPFADATSTVVYSYTELKAAVGEDNGYTTIYLGANITTDASGVSVHPNKPYLIIDGHPPAADDGVCYTFTQYTSTSLSYVIRVDDPKCKTREVTLRNMHIIGGNYYGVVAVSESVKGVTLTHENVSYTGPQPVYNRGGTTHFANSQYVLQPSGGVPVNELAETLHAEMSGKVTVVAAGTGSSILWLVGSDSTFALHPSADVTINTANYFIFTGGYAPGVTIGAGASLRVTDKFGFTSGDQAVSKMVLHENAQLYIEQNSTQSYAALRVSTLFEMRPGSSATIIRTGVDGIPLRLTSAGAKVIIDRPQRLFLYSSAGVPLRFTGAGTLTITAGAINVWNKVAWPVADTIDNMPSHIWNKAGDELLTYTAAYTTSTNNGITHNLTSSDPNISQLDAANFNLEKNQLIAIGSISLSVAANAGRPSAITGQSAALSELQAQYSATGGGKTAVTTAGGNGAFAFDLAGDALVAGDMVTVIANTDRLKMRQNAVVQEAHAGRLYFAAIPRTLAFGSIPMPGSQQLLSGGEILLSVSDTRAAASPWRVDVSVVQPFTANTSAGETTLPGALVFKQNGEAPVTLDETPYTVYRHNSGIAGDYDVSWGLGGGLFLELAPGGLYSGAEYTAVLQWSLVDAP